MALATWNHKHTSSEARDFAHWSRSALSNVSSQSRECSNCSSVEVAVTPAIRSHADYYRGRSRCCIVFGKCRDDVSRDAG